jgi:hypothetical protein
MYNLIKRQQLVIDGLPNQNLRCKLKGQLLKLLWGWKRQVRIREHGSEHIICKDIAGVVASYIVADIDIKSWGFVNTKCHDAVGAELADRSRRKAINPNLYVPLQFWFNSNPSLSLPIVSIPHGERRIDIELEPADRILDRELGT